MEKEKQFNPEGRSRSAQKRAAKEIADLAARLVEVPEAVLASLPLDEALRAELIQLRRTKGHGSRKRSLKHFAGLLRGDEQAREKLQAAMSRVGRTHGQRTANHHALEELRDRLCSADEQDAALQVVEASFPSVDHKALRRLIKSVRQGNDKRAYRDIFRRLREGTAH